MKTPLLTLILLVFCLAGIAQEPVEVMALMKDQYNRTELCQKAQYIPTRTARRTTEKLAPGVYVIQYQQGSRLKNKKVIIP